ncbi:putative phage abortive infection protein [Pseudomonas sp. GL-R-19]|uniref:putative phage abortive infection protein n=1 Tax=Pseudomonas sp. GL-R-19 TaxID=2832391 RepID=UPI001CBCE57D|nr:putative phage abortive infection protein [Pseudomonas sp. GL-R-19]
MKRDFWVVVIVGVVFLFIFAIYAIYYCFLYSGFNNAIDGALTGVRSGTFGDAFGTLNALFSGMAFAGVVVSLYLQRKDIKDSQHEVARQQAETARQQEESQFYNMLGLQQSVVRGFDLHKIHFDAIGGSTRPSSIQGRDCFKTWSNQLENDYLIAKDANSVDPVLVAYEKVWSKHRGDLSLYYRSLYNLFKFVSASSHMNKRWLGNVVRSLISDYELVILFYNCLSAKGAKFKLFANEFAIFDNLDPKILLDPAHALKLDKAAYGQNQEILILFPKTPPNE